MRELVKRIAFQALGSGYMLRRRHLIITRSGATTILNLHRVCENDGSGYRPLNPRIFDDLLRFVSDRFAVVTFADHDAPAKRPRLILSFDDGYKDFIEVAVPILDKYELSANQNIIPGCIESGLPPLNVMAQDFVGKAPAELVNGLNLPGLDVTDARNLSNRISNHIKYKTHKEQQAIAEMLLPQFFRWDGFRATPMMTLADVRQLKSVHEIGGHSYDHATMGLEEDDYVRNDVDRCRAYFRTHLDQDLNIYAFPNGSYRKSHLGIVSDAGVSHILLVDENFDVSSSVHRRFTYDAVTKREANFKALGGRCKVPA